MNEEELEDEDAEDTGKGNAAAAAKKNAGGAVPTEKSLAEVESDED